MSPPKGSAKWIVKRALSCGTASPHCNAFPGRIISETLTDICGGIVVDIHGVVSTTRETAICCRGMAYLLEKASYRWQKCPRTPRLASACWARKSLKISTRIRLAEIQVPLRYLVPSRLNIGTAICAMDTSRTQATSAMQDKQLLHVVREPVAMIVNQWSLEGFWGKSEWRLDRKRREIHGHPARSFHLWFSFSLSRSFSMAGCVGPNTPARSSSSISRSKFPPLRPGSIVGSHRNLHRTAIHTEILDSSYSNKKWMDKKNSIEKFLEVDPSCVYNSLLFFLFTVEKASPLPLHHTVGFFVKRDGKSEHCNPPGNMLQN